jgi:putative phage-type endonuclease
MKIYNLEQGTEEWFNVRAGHLTASNAQAISANGKGLESYVYQLLAEKYSNNRDQYTNSDIARGNELEPLARMTYEIEREKVEEVGFIELDKYVGCSPDGLIGKDGGLEIKCVNDVNFFKLIVSGEKSIETKYLWQCQMCLLITKRKFWDLAFYNPNFDRNLLIFRQKPDKAKQEKLKAGIKKGIELIKELTKKYETN